MWGYRIAGPRRLERVEVEPPAAPSPGEALIRLTAAGICGSDVVKFTGRANLTGRDRPGVGFPVHEVCGIVEASADPTFVAGQSVVGHCSGSNGLQELLVLPTSHLVAAPAGLTPADAVTVQPLATICYALDRLPDVRGQRAAVLGLGPIGLLFARLLHDRGAIVTGVDRVDRSAERAGYGITELVPASTADWIATGPEPFDVCIEAIGHQPDTLGHAIEAVGRGGTVYGFGVPDDEEYPLPFRSMFGRAVTLLTGVTQDWPRSLAAAADYLAGHRDLVDGPVRYVSHVVELAAPDAVNTAFGLAASAGVGRRKVVLSAGS